VFGQMRKRGGKNGFLNRFVQQSQRYLEWNQKFGTQILEEETSL
jgi:hypothetical protein